MIVALVSIVSTNDCMSVFTVCTIVVSFGVTSISISISTSSGRIVVYTSAVTSVGDHCTIESASAIDGARELAHSTAGR